MRECRGIRRLLWNGLQALPVLLLLVWGSIPEEIRAQEQPLDRFEYRQGHMGMEVRFVLYVSDEETAEGAARAAFGKVAMLDSLLSSYRSDSELMRVNRRAVHEPVAVSYHLFAILERAQEFARRSEGALDVTTGPFIQLWREARRTKQLPDSSTLKEAERRVGWRHLSLNEEASTVAFQRNGMELNLGGLAKGYILDQALKVLRDHGVSRALVEAGGDLATGASPPGRDGWTVDIPHGGVEDSSTVLTVSHSAVATSGDAVQYVEIGNERYSHVVDPRTGFGLTDQPTTTVVAQRGILADGLATTIGILGLQKGQPLIKTHYPCATVYVSTSDSTHVLRTK